MQIPTAKLNTGATIPRIGLGTWKSDEGLAKEAVQLALAGGYIHIDCASKYGNEKEVGEAFTAYFNSGKVPREKIFITSKLWNTDHRKVREACKQSLSDLGLDYLDLYLMHWPVTSERTPSGGVTPPLEDTWKEMEKLVEEGLVKAIGVSNYSIKKLKELLATTKTVPAVNQIEIHPYFRNDELIDFCKSKGIHVTAYSPLGSPDSAAKFKRTHTPLMKHPTVLEVAKSMDRSPAQVLIRWALQHGTSVLPKSVTQEYITSNLDVLDWELPAKEYQALSTLDWQRRMVDPPLKPEGPYWMSAIALWDDPTGLEDSSEDDSPKAGDKAATKPMANGAAHKDAMPNGTAVNGHGSDFFKPKAAAPVPTGIHAEV